jgi:hypothetical protein
MHFVHIAEISTGLGAAQVERQLGQVHSPLPISQIAVQNDHTFVGDVTTNPEDNRAVDIVTKPRLGTKQFPEDSRVTISAVHEVRPYMGLAGSVVTCFL